MDRIGHCHCRYLSIPPYTKSMPSTYYTIRLRFDIFLKPPPPPSLLNADQIMVIVIVCEHLYKMKTNS